MTGSCVIANKEKQSRDGEARVIVVHSLGQAIAAATVAARAGRSITLASAPDAGGHTGPVWFKALIMATRDAVPEVCFSALLDCGDNVGAALAAIRAEFEGVIFTGRTDVARRLADIAAQHGVCFETNRPQDVLDLGEDFFASEENLQ